MTFQVWKAKKQYSMTFQVFQDPYKPWTTLRAEEFFNSIPMEERKIPLHESCRISSMGQPLSKGLDNPVIKTSY